MGNSKYNNTFGPNNYFFNNRKKSLVKSQQLENFLNIRYLTWGKLIFLSLEHAKLLHDFKYHFSYSILKKQ